MSDKHTVCPHQFRSVDDVTGDYCLDGVLETVKNPELWAKLNGYLNVDTVYHRVAKLDTQKQSK
jgi:hypothetical protein